MATKVIQQLVSDLSGEEIADGGGQSIDFSVRGVAYRIDLTDREADKFDKALAPYIEAATKLGGRRRSASNNSKSEYDPKQVREWAKSAGLDVPARGRIPASVVEQYKAAN